jgi:hypothetical protein
VNIEGIPGFLVPPTMVRVCKCMAFITLGIWPSGTNVLSLNFQDGEVWCAVNGSDVCPKDQ